MLREWTGDDPSHVLDVGCGTGIVSPLLAALDHAVVGVNFAPEIRGRARTKARRINHAFEFLRGDVESFSPRDDVFELVTARHLVWTLPNPTAAIRAWRRVVVPDGRVLLIEGHWNHDEPWEAYEELYDDLPLDDGRPSDELSEVLSRAGLTDVTHEPLMDPV